MNKPDTRAISKAGKRVLTTPDEIVTTSNDPEFFSTLDILPNPDPILAKLGQDQRIYDAILYDTHVMSEIRSLRAGLLGKERRLKPGDMDDAKSMRAYEEISAFMTDKPAPDMSWDNLLWSIFKAFLYGQRVHEIGWEYNGRYLLPGLIKDRPARRFRYTLQNELRYLTRTSPLFGEEAPDEKRFLITRHMPDSENPYGVAVLSALYWPYLFKHNGWKWFVKLGEKYGIPWAIGRYPAGTELGQQKELEAALRRIVEAGVASIPEGTAVELLEVKNGGVGDSIQERIIKTANSEMSKALTSQTLSTEINDTGSRAASEVHRQEKNDISQTDCNMVSDSINQLLAWITELNFPGAKPPQHEFYEEAEPAKDWADLFDTARYYIDIPADWAYERLKIPPPEEGQAVLKAGTGDKAPFYHTATDHQKTNVRHGGDFNHDTDEASNGLKVDKLLEPVEKLLAEADSLEAFEAGLFALYPKMDDAKHRDYMALALSHGLLTGMDSADGS